MYLYMLPQTPQIFLKKITEGEYTSETYFKPSEAFNMELFKKLINNFKLYVLFTKSSILYFLSFVHASD